MKKLFITPCLVAAALLTSCNLDLVPQDKLADTNYFNNRAELEAFTNGFYSSIPEAATLYGETADIIIPSTLTSEVLGTRTVPGSGGGWSWTTLSDINTFLQGSNRCPDEAARKEYQGLARFFRAYFYFDKVKHFGEVLTASIQPVRSPIATSLPRTMPRTRK